MKVYLAHNWASRDWLKTEVVPKLEKAGIKVTSRWILDEPPKPPYTPEKMRTEAMEDVADVSRADVLVIFSENYGEKPGRGKYTELGMAIMSPRKRIIVVGAAADNVFYFLPYVERVDTVEQMINLLWAEEATYAG